MSIVDRCTGRGTGATACTQRESDRVGRFHPIPSSHSLLVRLATRFRSGTDGAVCRVAVRRALSGAVARRRNFGSMDRRASRGGWRSMPVLAPTSIWIPSHRLRSAAAATYTLPASFWERPSQHACVAPAILICAQMRFLRQGISAPSCFIGVRYRA